MIHSYADDDEDGGLHPPARIGTPRYKQPTGTFSRTFAIAFYALGLAFACALFAFLMWEGFSR